MSLKIIKAGIFDTIQDLGRYGYQHLGINPSGAMDHFSLQLANALLGKELHAPAIEMHFPAAKILFQQPSIICITGADFSPCINDKEISIDQPIAVNADAVLSFQKKKKGARCYLALLNDLQIESWLNSYSTNVKANAGGYCGRRLLKDDEIKFASIAFESKDDVVALHWKYHSPETLKPEIAFIAGPEWDWMTTQSQTNFLNNSFAITPASDRMGYRLKGEVLVQKNIEQLVSSAVSFGTVQLLPDGQLIILMADHQTTGGYPRIAHVVSADLSKLAQMNPGEEVKFEMVDSKAAEKKLIKQQYFLLSLQNTCKLKMWPPAPNGEWLTHSKDFHKVSFYNFIHESSNEMAIHRGDDSYKSGASQHQPLPPLGGRGADINCDMGEGIENDEALMPFITSANIACGYHAGDEETIRTTILLAKKYNVKIGAHPSFFDRENFGRTEMKCSPGEIYELIKRQLILFAQIAADCNATIHHVKPHGALYNMAAKDKIMASAIADAIFDFDKNLVLFGLSGSVSIDEAKKVGLKTMSEVFADRTYHDDGSLTPRSQPNALIEDEAKAVQQVLQMVKKKTVTTVSGKEIPIVAETICIHGDGKHAVPFAKKIYHTLQQHNLVAKTL